MKKSNGSKAGKLTHKEFATKLIVALRKEPYKGIHTVYSGFNSAFKEYYGEGADPVAATKALAESGEFVLNFAKGGAMLYLKADAPAAKSNGASILAKVGLL